MTTKTICKISDGEKFLKRIKGIQRKVAPVNTSNDQNVTWNWLTEFGKGPVGPGVKIRK